MKKINEIPRREAHSSLVRVKITPGRRTGNTTRIIDNAVQTIMSGNICLVHDITNSIETRNYLLHKITDRIAAEHPHVHNHNLCINEKEFALWLNNE